MKTTNLFVAYLIKASVQELNKILCFNDIDNICAISGAT